MSDWIAAAPLLCVVLGGLALMLVDAFVDEKSELATITAVVFASAVAVAAALWTQGGQVGRRLAAYRLARDRQAGALLRRRHRDGRGASPRCSRAATCVSTGSSAASSTRCCCSRPSAPWCSRARSTCSSLFVGPRDHVARRVRAGRLTVAPARARPRRASSTSCSARSPQRCCCSAAPTCTAPPATPTSWASRRPSRAASADSRLVLLALMLITAGLAFKVSAVPFHMWTPDAYEGATTPVTTFMAVCVKTAVFVVHGAPVHRGARRARAHLWHAPAGRPCWPGSPRSPWCSATSAPSLRTASSACWPTRRSRTPATS